MCLWAGAQTPSPELCSSQDIPGLESQRDHLEQPFLSVFKRGRRRMPVRNLGSVLHYAKVQLRFQHSQVRARWVWCWGQPTACPPAPHTGGPALPQDISDLHAGALPRGPSAFPGGTASGPPRPGWGRAPEEEREAGLWVEGQSRLGKQPTGKASPQGPTWIPRLEFGGSYGDVQDLWRPHKSLPSTPAWHLPMNPLKKKEEPLNSLMVLPVSWGPVRGQGHGAALALLPSWGWDRSCPPHTCDLEGMFSGPLQWADTQLHQW